MKTEKEIAEVFINLRVDRPRKEKNISEIHVAYNLITFFTVVAIVNFWDWFRGR